STELAVALFIGYCIRDLRNKKNTSENNRVMQTKINEFNDVINYEFNDDSLAHNLAKKLIELLQVFEVAIFTPKSYENQTIVQTALAVQENLDPPIEQQDLSKQAEIAYRRQQIVRYIVGTDLSKPETYFFPLISHRHVVGVAA